jgi:malonyl-CoA/methylmalonyl-CoA synthetase
MTPHFLNELRGTIADRSDRTAVVHRGQPHSFGEIELRARSGAALLRQCGMERGDRVLLVTAAKLPFLLSHLAILYGGGISVPLNPRFTREEMRHFLLDSQARLAVVGDEQRSLFESLRAEGPELQIVPDVAVAEASAATWREPGVGADDPCLMIYSSGTTGLPKGVVHTYANVASSLRALEKFWRISPDDVVVNVLPLFHIHGLSFAAQMPLLAGACVLLEDAFDPPSTLDAISRATVFMAVPTMYYRFLEQSAFAEKARGWHQARLFTCGSAPIRPEVLPRLEAILGSPVINRYGMSEAHVISSLPLDGPWPAGSVGLPLDGIELRITRQDGSLAAEGEMGAVQVRGPNLFREYWRNPDATRKAFATGWFDTGDIGHRDGQGFLYLVGRSNDLIISAGYNVYPQVVERVLNACPGVRESAVAGVPDTDRGESVAAFVVCDDAGLTAERLQAFVRERLVDYQRPRRVFFVEALPRNALGKVLRKELASLAERTP